MAHIRRLLQTRPNADTNFFVPETDLNNLVETYKSSGKILEYTSINNEDGLTNTISLKFNTIDDWNEFQLETVADTSARERYDYCSSNSISWSVEDVEDNS